MKTLTTLFSSYYYQSYFSLMLYASVAFLICSLLAVLAYIFSFSSSQDTEKKSEYECGFEPFDSATRLPFDVHFYLVGILFLIFDVEVALLFPWVMGLRTCGWFGFYLMLGFILLLSVGFLYEWKRGALIWPSRQKELAFTNGFVSNCWFFLLRVVLLVRSSCALRTKNKLGVRKFRYNYFMLVLPCATSEAEIQLGQAIMDKIMLANVDLWSAVEDGVSPIIYFKEYRRAVMAALKMMDGKSDVLQKTITNFLRNSANPVPAPCSVKDSVTNLLNTPINDLPRDLQTPYSDIVNLVSSPAEAKAALAPIAPFSRRLIEHLMAVYEIGLATEANPLAPDLAAANAKLLANAADLLKEAPSALNPSSCAALRATLNACSPGHHRDSGLIVTLDSPIIDLTVKMSDSGVNNPCPTDADISGLWITYVKKFPKAPNGKYIREVLEDSYIPTTYNFVTHGRMRIEQAMPFLPRRTYPEIKEDEGLLNFVSFRTEGELSFITIDSWELFVLAAVCVSVSCLKKSKLLSCFVFIDADAFHFTKNYCLRQFSADEKVLGFLFSYDYNYCAFAAEFLIAFFLTMCLSVVAVKIGEHHSKKIISLEILRATKIILVSVIIVLERRTKLAFVFITCNGYLFSSACTAMFQVLLTVSILFILELSIPYIKSHKKDILEYPLIITFSYFFMFVMVGSGDMLSAFFSLIGFSLNIYVLILFDATESVAREAGVKYYYLSTFSSGLLLYGIFLIFFALRTLHVKNINLALVETSFVAGGASVFLLFGLFLFSLGIFFKLAAFPGHLWAADVYEGSSGVMLGFFMLPVKIATLSFILQVMSSAFFAVNDTWQPFFIFSAVGSLLWGGLAAAFERKTRRFLAYAAINQIGFILIGIASGSFLGFWASVIYLWLYTLMNFCFLSVYLSLSTPRGKMTYLTDFRGMCSVDWLYSWGLSSALLSMAGIPPLAGFFGKYFLLLSAQTEGLLALVAAALCVSLLSAYYYLRVIKIFWFESRYLVVDVRCAMPCAQKAIFFVAEATLWLFIFLSSFVLSSIDHFVAILTGTSKITFLFFS